MPTQWINPESKAQAEGSSAITCLAACSLPPNTFAECISQVHNIALSSVVNSSLFIHPLSGGLCSMAECCFCSGWHSLYLDVSQDSDFSGNMVKFSPGRQSLNAQSTGFPLSQPLLRALLLEVRNNFCVLLNQISIMADWVLCLSVPLPNSSNLNKLLLFAPSHLPVTPNISTHFLTTIPQETRCLTPCVIFDAI